MNSCEEKLQVIYKNNRVYFIREEVCILFGVQPLPASRPTDLPWRTNSSN